MSRLFESSLTAKISNMLVEEEHLKESYCPRCGIAMQGYPATSRFDNKTEICSDCGTDEAMKNFTGETLEDPNKYDTKTGKKLVNAVEPNRNDMAGDSKKNLEDIKEAALPQEPPTKGKNERIADFIIDYDVFEFRNVYDGDNDEERRTQLIDDIDKDPEAARKYVQDIADNDDRPEWRDQAEQTLKLFESAPSGEDLEKDDKAIKDNKKAGIEARIGELRQAIADGVSDDEKAGMEKEIAELEDKLNESAEGVNDFWSKFDAGEVKVGDDFGGIKLIDANKEKNYILVNRNKGYQPFVAAWAPELDGDKLVWGQGHYFDSEEGAKEYFSNKLNESALNEDSYNSGIFKDIENALTDAGFSVDRFTDAGVLSGNIGWDVSNESGSTQLQCNGSYYSDPKDDVEDAFDGTDFIVNSCEVDGDTAYVNVSAFGPSEDGEDTEEMTRDIELDISNGAEEAVEEWIASHNSPDTFYESALNEVYRESSWGPSEMKYDLIDAVKKCLSRYKNSFKEFDLNKMREIIKSALDYTNSYFEKEDFMYYINEGAKVTESDDYSEKLGGTPSDFISDVNTIIDKVNEIDTNKLATKLAYQMVEDFTVNCEDQIKMVKDRYLDESVNVVTSDGSTVDTNDGASVTSNDGNVTVVTTDGTTVSINSTPEEPVMDVPVDEPTKVEVPEEPVEEIPTEEVPTGEVPTEEPIEDEPVEEAVALDEPTEEDDSETIDAKSLSVIKNQGNVFMLQIKDGNGSEKYWVCEDFNQGTNEGNNASSYDSKEEADDDYFHRVGLNVGDAAGDTE